MSSKKIILMPNGKIKKDGEENDPQNISSEILSQQDDFFKTRGGDFLKAPASFGLPTGVKGIASRLTDNSSSNDFRKFGIIAKDENSSDKNKKSFLRNESFDFIREESEKEDLNYYMNFNSAFSNSDPTIKKFDLNKNLFADELEILGASFNFNTIGPLSAKGFDFTKTLFVFDYLLETIVYNIFASYIVDFFDNNSVIKRYFTEVLQYKKNENFAICFIYGMLQFLDADNAIIGSNKSAYRVNNKYYIIDPEKNINENAFRVFLKILSKTLTNSSKQQSNRLFMLIRKFQQESYWHSNILYKAKDNYDNDDLSKFTGLNAVTSENALDKFFVEFSYYYFKFMIERAHIGKLYFENIFMFNQNIVDQRYRHLNPFFTENANPVVSKIKHGTESSYLYSGYSWKEYEKNPVEHRDLVKEHGKESRFSETSNLRLPQLIKNYDANIELIKDNEILSQNIRSTESKRFSSDLVRKLEEHLGKEYMPFYFHDLRTNEILSFHAFIDSITDNFNPEYNVTSGYGRIDDVRHYIKTTRNININFSIVATDKISHNLMWHQINKLVSMVYPQWSGGIDSDNKSFKLPFSQMPTASPLIRIRLGDILTSNYSIKSMAGLHGKRKIIKKKDDKETISNIEVKEDASANKQPSQYKFYKRIITKTNIKITEKFKVYKETKVSPAIIIGKNYAYYTDTNDSIKQVKRQDYTTYISDSKHADVIIMLENTKSISIGEGLEIKEEILEQEKNKSVKKINKVVASTIGEKINNPFTKAYESSRGEGIAGFITMLDVNYNDMVWEISEDSKAPMMTKITCNFAPIHDIPPGLDHNGVMRSSVYRAGKINKNFFGNTTDKKLK